MNKKNIAIIFIICFIFLNFYNIVFANEVNDLQNQLYNAAVNDNKLYNAAEVVLGIIKWIGVAILVGCVIVKGIHYVTVSPEGKAEIKKDIVMIVIGAVILFGFVELIEILFDLVSKSGVNKMSI